MVELIVSDDTRLHVWLIFLVVQPQLDNYHNLEIIIDVLNLVSFILVKVILYLFSRDIVKQADLVECIRWDAFKPLAMLRLGE